MPNSSLQISRLLMIMLSGAALSGCGGGSGSGSASPAAAPVVLAGSTTPAPAAALAPAAAEAPAAPAPATSAPSAPVPTTTEPAVAPPPPTVSAPAPPPTTLTLPAAGTVTDVRLQNTLTLEQTNVPVTFGQVFAPGHLAAGQTVRGKLADGSLVPLQLDVKARHADGSVRHALVSASLLRLAGGQNAVMALEKIADGAAATPATPAALLEAGFSAAAHADLNGVRYSASADALLRSGKYTSWMAGPVANEWLLAAPLTSAQGAVHPHLSARFAIRAYGSKQARVDVTIENGWAYEEAPQNFLYDAQITVGGQAVYTKPGLNHLHHARWRKVFWWGGAPAVHVKHNVAYLIGSRALPNYDQSVVFAETRLAAWKTGFAGVKTEPMGVGLARPYMPATGGRDDIGLMPGWAATYLLTMDQRMKDVTLGTADLAGSWSIHYRDKKTDRPVSLIDYPYMTVMGRSADTYNPATKLREAFPICAPALCVTPNTHDTSHQAAFAYLPYLVTGDYFYLEELQFWGMYNVLSSNPGYREAAKGLVNREQVRSQAWTMRTLGEAAYISPDGDRLKAHFAGFVNYNLDWFNTNYTNNAATNAFGALTNGYALAYNDSTGIAPWQDDFFTSSIGHLSELGFAKAVPLLKWKATFSIARMTDKGFCWIEAGIYALKVRDTKESPFYTSIGEAYQKSHTEAVNAMACNSTAMATAFGGSVGEMTGYAGSHIGYPSNMQPALAFAADVGGTSGSTAWSVFAARTVKPNYSNGPQFAIVPR